MKDLKDTLSSPIWWITVVVAGILINLVSAYLKTKLDERLALLSSWWRRRTEKRMAAEKAKIEKLRSSPHEQVMAKLEEVVCACYAVVMLVFGFGAMSFSVRPGMGQQPPWITVTLYAVSSVAVFLGFLLCMLSFNLGRTLDDARTAQGEKAAESA